MNEEKQRHHSSENPARILVVDDHAIVREGLIKLINQESDLMVCEQAENANQALQVIDKQQIDLAIVDISLEGVNGLELTESWGKERSESNVCEKILIVRFGSRSFIGS